MRYMVSNAAQRTPEWHQARLGKATGSRAADITATIKSGEAAARRNYRVQLVTERLTGACAEECYVSKEMQDGIDNEPFARMEYEIATGEIVQEAGFTYLPNIAAGCSVDGFIGDEGIFEAKCPKSATHVSYLLAARLPPEYVPQVKHNLWITGCEFCDFASFDPRMPKELRLFKVRVYRNELDIAGYEAELLKFLGEVDALELQLRARTVALAKAA